MNDRRRDVGQSFFLKWLIEGMKKPGKSKIGLAQALGIGQTQAARILDNKRDLKAKDLIGCARYIEEPMPIVPGVPRAKHGKSGFRIAYSVDSPLLPKRDTVAAHLLTDAEFSFLPHYATLMQTAHLDLRIPVGFYAIWVPYFEARSNKIESGDIVVAEAIDKISSASTALVRRIVANGTNLTLVCMSSDYRLNTEIITLNRKLIDIKTNQQINIVGLVTYCVGTLREFEHIEAMPAISAVA